MRFPTALQSVFFVGVCLAATPAHAFGPKAPLHCDSYSSDILGRYVAYCLDRSRPDLPTQAHEPVVFFMHGTNGGAHTWWTNGYQDALAALRKERSLQPMTFVAFDTSNYSFFTDHPADDGDTSEAYETWFVDEFVPYIEKTYEVCSSRACRGILGESMGGMGAIKTALKHPELFSSVATNSPALAPFETMRPFWDWVGFFADQKIGPIWGFMMSWILFDVIPDEQSFEANDPVHLVRHYSADFPSLYFDMGGEDDYGFYVGYGRFKQALDAREVPYTTIFEPHAGHDMWKRHAKDAILFEEEHLAGGNSSGG